MIALIVSQIWPYILAGVALVAGWFAARQSGKSAVRNEITKAESAARKEARNVEMETDGMADSDIDDDLSRWVRGAKR